MSTCTPTLSPSSSSLHRLSSSPAKSLTTSTPPLSPTRSVLSVQLFQERHISEFAHLHSHDDNDTRRLRLAMEKGRLEEERRIGREKRQSMMGGRHQKTANDARSTWRPLSLLQKIGEPSHRRVQCFSAARSMSQPSGSRTQYLFSPEGIHSRTGPDTPSSAFAVAKKREISHGSYALDVVEQDTSPPVEETSFSNSTYSWATQYSGETIDLRNTSRFIPPVDVSDEEEILDSPERLDRRRKRIVAIAHTVRQLEGIGSREKADPAYYDVIAKAWYDRPDTNRGEPAQSSSLLPAPSLPPTPNLPGDIPHFLPDFENGSTLANGFSSLRGYPPGPSSTLSSPLDAEFRTPDMPMPAQFDRQSTSTSRRSRSTRYSHASTLHDLALDGGLQQGSKLMSEKAWLRTSKIGTPWGGDFDIPSKPCPPTPPEPIPLESPILLTPQNPPERTLRKYKTTINQLRPTPSADPSLSTASDTTPKAGPSRGWGLGFVSSWWDTPSNTAATTTVATVNLPSSVEQDFHIGEDGIPRESRSSADEANLNASVQHQHRLSLEGIEGNPRDSQHSNRSRQQSLIHSTTSLSRSRSLSMPQGQEVSVVVASGDTSETSSFPSTKPQFPILPQSQNTQSEIEHRATTTMMSLMMMTPPQLTVSRNQHPSYDHWSSPDSWLDTLTPVELKRETASPTLTSTPKIESAESSVGADTVEKPFTRRSNVSIFLFFAGFLVPFLWVAGGWLNRSASTSDLENGDKNGVSKWIHSINNPDPWATRCRWATIVGLPFLVIGTLIAVIIYLALR